MYKDSALKDLKLLNNGQVEVLMEQGNTAAFETVIGADSICSGVRKHIINDGGPIFRGYNIGRGIEKTSVDIGYASETIGKGQRVGIVPVGEGVYGWWATLNEGCLQDDQPEGTKEKLKRLFGD